MREMNYLDKLLDGVGVEWKALGDIAEIRSGWGFPNVYQGKTDGIYPFYKVSDMNIVGNETTMVTTSLKREFASDNGTELNAVLPRMSPLNPQYLTKKQSVFQKIAAFVEKFKGVGGQV